MISDCFYDVKLALPKGDVFFGVSKAFFTLDAKVLESSKSHPIDLDFRGVKVTDVTINGTEITEGLIFDKHVLSLPKSALKAGENVVSLSFFNKYRKDGVGLHSFIDSADN